MRALLFAIFFIMVTCSAHADSNRATGILDVLKSQKFTIQFITDGSRKVVGGVTVLPLQETQGNQTVTLIQDGDKKFISIDFNENSIQWTTCCLKDKDWCYNYHICNGSYYDGWNESFRQANHSTSFYNGYIGSSTSNLLIKEALLKAEIRNYSNVTGKNQRFEDNWLKFLEYIGIAFDSGDMTKPVIPIQFKGRYYTSGQETINDITYDYDEYWDDSTPKFVAKNRYYYRDGYFDKFISLGDSVVIDYWKYVNLCLHPGRPIVVNLKPSSQAKVVTITHFSNTADPAAFEFPANVKFKEIAIGNDRERLEKKDRILVFDKQKKEENRRKLEKAIKDLLSM